MAEALHVSISAETVVHIFGLELSNSIVTSLVVSMILIVLAVLFHKNFQHTNRPSAWQNVVEMIVEALYNFVHSITDNHAKSRQFFPIIATFFLFILLNNYVGLLPGVGPIMVEETHVSQETVTPVVHAVETDMHETVVSDDAHGDAATTSQDEYAAETTGTAQEHTGSDTAATHHSTVVPLFRAATADLNTTLALALISVSLTQIFGFAHLGWSYFKKFFDFSSGIAFFVGILELVLEIAKVVSFAFRLFGNIFAGEVLLVVMLYLASLAVPAPFYALELFVGFIQALVFSMLSLIFFNLATKGHHQEEHEAASH